MTIQEYCLKDLESCLIRFLHFLNEFKDCEKAELNDFEIIKDDLKAELKLILEDI